MGGPAGYEEGPGSGAAPAVAISASASASSLSPTLSSLSSFSLPNGSSQQSQQQHPLRRWEICPGRSVGEFVLGHDVKEMMEVKRRMRMVTATTVTATTTATMASADVQDGPSSGSGVSSTLIDPANDLVVDRHDPLQQDLRVVMHDCHMTLTFDAISHALKLIHIAHPEELDLVYAQTTCSSADVPPVYSTIYSVFGPTHPGMWEPLTSTYVLQYPGISFCFHVDVEEAAALSTPMPTQFEASCELPDTINPLVTSILVYHGRQLHGSTSASASASTSATSASSSTGSSTATSAINAWAMQLPPLTPDIELLREPVHVHILNGAFFARRRAWITFRSTVQDVLSDFGPPDDVLVKRDERMSIHAYADVDGGTAGAAAAAAVAAATATGAAMTTDATSSRSLSTTARAIDKETIVSPASAAALTAAIDAAAASATLHTRRSSGMGPTSSTLPTPAHAPTPTSTLTSGTAATPKQPRSLDTHDYFYNYFALGFDVLFDGAQHRVKKIILHMNFPGHADFHRYARPNVAIHLDGVGVSTVTPATTTAPPDISSLSSSASLPVVDITWTWPDIARALHRLAPNSVSRPLVHRTTKEHNPFGSTLIYASPGALWEVIKQHQHVCTLTLFEDRVG